MLLGPHQRLDVLIRLHLTLHESAKIVFIQKEIRECSIYAIYIVPQFSIIQWFLYGLLFHRLLFVFVDLRFLWVLQSFTAQLLVIVSITIVVGKLPWQTAMGWRTVSVQARRIS